MSLLRVSTHRAFVAAPQRIIAVRTVFNTSNDHPTAGSKPPASKNEVSKVHVQAEPPHDRATSAYSPSKAISPEEHIHEGIPPAGILSGAPTDLQTRVVRIYMPAKAATQSGTFNTQHWRLDWDILSKGHRWENPLMGWQSSADYTQGTHITFKTKEDAIYFAEKQGYEWFVQEPKEREIKPKAYANNFNWSAKKLKLIHTK